MRSPRDFFKPLALGAPDAGARDSDQAVADDPLLRSVSNPKMAAKVPELAQQADILLGNLEDAIPADKKIAAREGLVTDRPRGRLRRHAALDARQQPRQAVVPRRHHAARRRDRQPARGDHDPQGRGAVGHPLRRPPAGAARGASTRCSGRSSSTPSSRPRSASPTSRRSAPRARACRASASARPISRRRAA